MRIKPVGHAAQRMEERSVTMDDIRHALDTYQLSESLKLDADPGKSRILGASKNGYRLSVVVLGELPPLRLVRVVSVYWKPEGGQR